MEKSTNLYCESQGPSRMHGSTKCTYDFSLGSVNNFKLLFMFSVDRKRNLVHIENLMPILLKCAVNYKIL